MAINPANIKFFESAASSGGIDSLGGAITATEVSGSVNALFDLISATESANGDVEYRVIYVQNKSFGTGANENDLLNPKVSIATNATDPDTTIEFAIPDNVNVTAASIADEDTSPGALTWYGVADGPQALSADLTFAGNTNAGDFQAIFLRRSVVNTNNQAANDSAVISVSGETTA